MKYLNIIWKFTFCLNVHMHFVFKRRRDTVPTECNVRTANINIAFEDQVLNNWNVK